MNELLEEIKKEINSIDDLNTQEGLISIDQVFEILDKHNNQPDVKNSVVTGFKWEKGVNDVEYIKLLENLVAHQKQTIGNAIKELHKENYYETAWNELLKILSYIEEDYFWLTQDIKNIEQKYKLGGE